MSFRRDSTIRSASPSSTEMLHLIRGLWISQSIYVAAKLRLPDLLKDGPKSSDELARVTRTDSRSLFRLLRALTSIGLFVQNDDTSFAVTDLGATLQEDSKDSLLPWALMALNGEEPRAWSDLEHSVQTGGIAFNHVFGMNIWKYRAEHPEHAAIFDKSQSSTTNVLNRAIVEHYSFANIRNVVDIGGGYGSLIIILLKGNEHLQGLVFDLPHVAEKARMNIVRAGFSSRCDIVSGDVFDSVPTGGEVYILSRVLHDWDNERSLRILRNCNKAMQMGKKLLLIERIIPSKIEKSESSESVFFMDLHMMVATGGQERTDEEFRSLFDESGFRLDRIIPIGNSMNVIEGLKVQQN